MEAGVVIAGRRRKGFVKVLKAYRVCGKKKRRTAETDGASGEAETDGERGKDHVRVWVRMRSRTVTPTFSPDAV
ncbi:hypothetical protein [Burkholderia vietnamiensis]|uniref:hypothetical protein n=1 Tax=Burkholderia vietnamiensis TaxID=60552 RepID=UPI0012DB301A|nr:hypothetical protein [Burkholderia vietnamiensis]